MSETTRLGGANGAASARSLLRRDGGPPESPDARADPRPDTRDGARPDQAEFLDRRACVSCGGTRLEELSRGRYHDEPLAGFLRGDPWGRDPLPHLERAEWVFVRCAECRMMFHRLVLTPEWNERRFSEWMSAEAIEEFERRLPDPVRRRFEKGKHYAAHVLRIEALTRPIRKPGEAVRMLDFGCGWGDCLAVGELLGFEVQGVDRSTARRDGCRVPVAASIEELGAAPGSFHAAALFETLEHLDDPAGILRQVGALIAPGGVLILETPDCRGVTGIQSEHDYRAIGPIDHVNGFTHETLRSIAERNAGVRWIPRRAAYVTADLERVARTAVKRLLRHDDRSTQLYFVKA